MLLNLTVKGRLQVMLIFASKTQWHNFMIYFILNYNKYKVKSIY